jgi:hypothetical protein
MKKKIAEDEIDLLESLITISNNKWKIFLATILAITITYILELNQQPAKSAFSTETKIDPISTFDEFEYAVYNSFLNNMKSKSIFHTSVRKSKYDPYTQKNVTLSDDVEIYKIIDYSYFKKIDKSYLLDLFIDKLNQNSLFINAVKKFNLVKREDFQDNEAYEKALNKLASSISLLKNDIDEPFWYIKYHTDNKEIWESFLKFIQESANAEVQKYLFDSFNELIVNEKRLNKFKIEDIDLELSNNKDNIQIIKKLENMKLKLLANKDVQRLENLYSRTPIAKQERFTAASIRIQSTKYESLNKKDLSLATKLFIAGLFGAFLSVLYVLTLNAVQNRRKVD